MIFSHTTLTTCTGHDALLVCHSGHKSIGSPLSWLDPKEVPQMKGDITQPALFMTVRLPYPTLPSPIPCERSRCASLSHGCLSLIRFAYSGCVYAIVRGGANVFELLIGERRCALLAQMEIVGGIHGERTMQSLWYKHAWCTGHDVAGGIVGRYDARAIKRPTARAILGWCPRYELNVRQTV